MYSPNFKLLIVSDGSNSSEFKLDKYFITTLPNIYLYLNDIVAFGLLSVNVTVLVWSSSSE